MVAQGKRTARAVIVASLVLLALSCALGCVAIGMVVSPAIGMACASVACLVASAILLWVVVRRLRPRGRT